MVQAYSRQNPKYRRLYKSKELKRMGYMKFGEKPIHKDRLLIYRRRWWQGGVQTSHFITIHPDGSTVGRYEVEPMNASKKSKNNNPSLQLR
jgi:hypothetical protein